MNRQSVAQFGPAHFKSAVQLRLSSLHFQQGVWAALALLVTLVTGQQWLLWHESQQPEAPQVSIHRALKPISAPSAALKKRPLQCA